MDEKRKKEIDTAWRKARRAELFEGMRKAKLSLLLCVAAIVAVVFLSILFVSPAQRLETVRGRLVGQFVAASQYTSGYWRVSVRLDGGEVVSADMPRTQTYRPEAPANVTRYRRSVGTIGVTFYRVDGYAAAVW